MKVFVTGSQGYIGCRLVEMLLAKGHEVVGCDTQYYSHFLERPPGLDGVPHLFADVRDLTARQLAGFDAVAHLAGLSNDPMGALNATLTDEINHRASVALAKSAKEAGVKRFIFASSCSVYGEGGDGLVTEESAVLPLTAYAQSKLDAERSISAVAHDGFSPTFLRNATAYGVSAGLRLDLVLNNLTAWAFATGAVKIMSDGTPWRPLVHVDDICQAFTAVLDAPTAAVHNEVFNVGDDSENYQIRDIGEMICRTVPNSTISYGKQASPDSRTYKVSFRKIQERLPHFRPRWTAQRGVEQVYEAAKGRKLTASDLESRQYVRLKQLRFLLEENRVDANLRWVPESALSL